MRRPDADPYAWHRAALAGRAVLVNEEPHPGWYQRKLVKHAVWVPAHIWLQQELGDDGELLEDVQLLCEVNGRSADPFEQWSFLAGNPISEAEFKYLTARNTWAGWYAPHEPAGNPQKPVNWLKSKPVF